MDGLINFIREVGVDNFIRLLWAGTIIIISVSVFFGARAVYTAVKRGNPAQETVARALEREYERAEDLREDVTNQSNKYWTAIAEKAKVEEDLKACQEKLIERGIGSMTLAEENALRNMIVRKQHAIKVKNERIKILTEALEMAGINTLALPPVQIVEDDEHD